MRSNQRFALFTETQCVALFYAARLRINLAGLPPRPLLLFAFKYLTGKLAFEISILVSCVCDSPRGDINNFKWIAARLLSLHVTGAAPRAEILIFMSGKKREKAEKPSLSQLLQAPPFDYIIFYIYILNSCRSTAVARS